MQMKQALVIVLNILNCFDICYAILLFPNTSIFQFTYGFDNVIIRHPPRIVVWGLGVQTTFDYPYSLSNFEVATYEAKSTADMSDISRETLYRYIIGILENIGFLGEQCLLRAICEVAHIPFDVDKRNSILEKIAHFIFTPSISFWTDTLNGQRNYSDSHEFKDNLLLAEDIGRKEGNCKHTFPCSMSIIDLISKVFSTR